jgi:hypothetical protein
MANKDQSAPRFPAINLAADRERVQRGGVPTVRARFWLALAASVALLIVIMGIQLMPNLLVQR